MVRTGIIFGVVAAIAASTALVAQSGEESVELTDGRYTCDHDYEPDGFTVSNCVEVTPSTTTTSPTTSTTTTPPPVPSVSSTLPESTTTTEATTSTSTTAPTTTTSPQPSVTTSAPATSTTPPTTTTGPPATTTSTVAPTTTAPPAGVAFSETFDTAASVNRFWRHTGNSCSLAPNDCLPEERPDIAIQSFPGSHNTACAAPPTTRTVSIESHANLYWWCAPGGPTTGHMMTGLNTSGYAIVAFAPSQWFTNVRRVCWDMSLADLGGGKWANVVLVPRAKVESHPNPNRDRVVDGEGPWRLDYVTPGFDPQDHNGPGGFNLVDIDGIVGVKQFRGDLGIYQGHTMAQQQATWTNGANESARFRHCFEDLGNGNLRVTQNRNDGVVQTFTTPGAFPDGQVAVIFEDDTYDADKHGGTGLYTWHFDNIMIEVD